MPDEANVAAEAQTGTWIDPFGAFNFELRIQGVTAGHFTQCSGMGARVQAIPYREAGAGQIIHQVAGPIAYMTTELRYGLTTSTELWDWFQAAARGAPERRRHCSIVVLGSDGATPAVRWDLIDAWPTEWSLTPLDALGREIAIESLKLVYESIERVRS